MQFLLVLVLLAVLLHAGEANEHELAEEQTRNAQQMIDESNEAIINAIADQYPELREEMHERRLSLTGFTVVKYLGYYQFSTFLVNNKPSCNGNGAPFMATGVGYGCINILATCRENTPCSYAQTCEEASGGVKVGVKMYTGPNCTGNEINTGMGGNYGKSFGACRNGVKYSCASANGPPASRYDGYRVTTYFNTDMCMGQPMSYTDYYNGYNSKNFFCKDGKVSYKSGTTTRTQTAVTCISSTSAITTFKTSVAKGCISAMKSTSERTYIKFNLAQIIKGLSSSVWNKTSNKSKNYIALATALARILSLDYNAIEDLKVTPKVTSSAPSSGLQAVKPEVEVTYTIKVQPGFGNDYTEDNVYSSLKSKIADATKATCTGSNCFLPALKSVAPSSISSGVTSTSYDPSATTPPSVVKQVPTSSSPPASESTTKKSSGAAVAGAVVGSLVFVGAIGGFFYYTRVYKPKQLAQAAANMPPAPQVPGASNPVHASPGAANFASPPPPYPQI